MTMKRFRFNRRAVSPIIATLLLVAIAVAASVITYTWAMSMTGNEANKSQTSIAIDKVMFGQTGTTTLNGAVLIGVTSIPVQSTVGFANADVITIGTGTGAESLTISSLNSISNTITTTTQTTKAHSSGAAIITTSPTQSQGIWASIRNSGSVAATIDTIYLFNGDSLVFKESNINYVIPVGGSRAIGINTVTSGQWEHLTSGGSALPGYNTIKDSVTFQGGLSLNSAYQLKILTNNGFQTVGTYFTPGQW